MFEYWFLNLRDSQDPEDSSTFSHHGTTHDFLEVVSQIALFYTPTIAGLFVVQLLEDKHKDLAFLRVIDWKIEFTVLRDDDDPRKDQIIRLHKMPR